MKKRHYIVAAILVIFFLLFRFVGEIGRDSVTGYRVVRIIDGDTIELADRGRVRLLGIDTPEEGELFYDSAAVFLRNLILGREVSLQFGFRKRDNYDRLLAYVYMDSILVNAAIIRSGWGHLYLYPENMDDGPVLAALIEAQRLAMQKNIGVWTIPPLLGEDYYIGNGRSYRFHRPSCQSIKKMNKGNRVIFESREEAFYEGFAPCRNCRP